MKAETEVGMVEIGENTLNIIICTIITLNTWFSDTSHQSIEVLFHITYESNGKEHGCNKR